MRSASVSSKLIRTTRWTPLSAGLLLGDVERAEVKLADAQRYARAAAARVTNAQRDLNTARARQRSLQSQGLITPITTGNP